MPRPRFLTIFTTTQCSVSSKLTPHRLQSQPCSFAEQAPGLGSGFRKLGNTQSALIFTKSAQGPVCHRAICARTRQNLVLWGSLTNQEAAQQLQLPPFATYLLWPAPAGLHSMAQPGQLSRHKLHKIKQHMPTSTKTTAMSKGQISNA